MIDKELTEKKNDLITRAEAVVNKAKEEKRELTEAEAAELAEIRDNVRKIVESLDLMDDVERMAQRKDECDREAEPQTRAAEEDVEAREAHAFENFLRDRVVFERSGELTPASTSGGYMIPTTIANRVIKRVYDICPILERSSKYNVKGNLDLPYYDTSSDTITVSYADEFEDLTSHSGKFTKITLGGFLCGALTKISRSLINNTEFDIVAFVVDEMAYAIKRFIEGELLHGTASKIEGLSGLTNGIVAGSATTVTADEIVRLHDAVKDEYQANGIWIMSPATRTAVRTLKANTGYYLLQDDISTPFGASILGKPVYVSDNMPDMASGKVAIIYGDLSGLATKFSEDVNIEVLREAYAAQHAVGVVAWFECDGQIENQQKLAKLTMKTV